MKEINKQNKEGKSEEDFLIIDRDTAMAPEFFSAMMSFQYGTLEESAKGYGEMRKIAQRAEPKEPESQMPSVKLEKNKVWLLHNGTGKSRLAEDYLKKQNISYKILTTKEIKIVSGGMCAVPIVRMYCSEYPGAQEVKAFPRFANTAKEQVLPALITKLQSSSYNAYFSFSGVKSFIRDTLRNELNGENEEEYWRNIETLCDSVTCFDIGRKKVFEGHVDDAPYNIKEQLALRNFRLDWIPRKLSWDKVSCWHIGSLEELVEKQNNEIVVDEKTRTILFPDEIETLQKGRRVITQDISFFYGTTYKAYFNEREQIFGIYANYIFD